MKSKRRHASVKNTRIVQEKRGDVNDKMNVRGLPGEGWILFIGR